MGLSKKGFRISSLFSLLNRLKVSWSRFYFVLLLTVHMPFTFLGNAKANDKVIYGEDNRVDVEKSNNAFYQELSLSTAAMISKSSMTFDDQSKSYKLVGKKLKDRGMCPEERFTEQLAVARCSGMLVGDNILVTAGHCVRNEQHCNSYNWVFDFRWNEENNSEEEYFVQQQSVYSCKRVIKIVYDHKTMNDYAVVELERKVTDRSPLEFRREGNVQLSAPLVVIGHPIGLPTKIADGANVRSSDESNVYFQANLDTYGGNSGSAVMDADTGVIEGILVRGESDFVWDKERKCRRSKICTNDDCRGEDVTRITNLTEYLPSKA